MAVTTYTREQVYEASLTYFNGDALAAGVFTDKYALRDREGRYYELTPDDMHRRLAREFARIEAKYPNPLSEHFIYQHLKNFSYIVPQGSPMFGIGNNFQLVSTSNCAVVESPQDTMSSIFDAARDMANLYKRRFGVGIDISNLRPAGAPVNNAAVTSTGAWSFADFYSYVTRMVGQSGRRGALMITLDVRHPDIEHFITMKADLTKVTGANVSVKVSDDFMRAVENDEEYVLHFPVGAPPGQRTFERVVRARDIFKLIAKTANDTAEPGFLYWDTITRNLPLDNYEGFKTVSTNPCGEIPLCGNDSCRLISIYLPAFVENPFEEGKASFNFRRLYDTARVAMRLADDLVDLELEKLHAIRDQADTEDEKRLFTKFIEACEKGRRTGLGTHGLGDALARLRLRYDSEEALKMADKIYMTIKFAAYRESVEMAKDRGPFPIWDWEVEKDCEFFQRMAEEQLDIEGVRYGHGLNLIADMMKYGRRNGAILTNAPTGSVSILSGNCSSGIEPVFRNSYVRRRKVDASMKAAGIVPDFVDATGDEWVHYTVYHPNVQMYREKFGLKDDDPLPDFFVTADQIDPIMRVRMQATIQRHIDHSLSSTLNLPRETTPDVVEKIYMEAWKLGCKGVTVYRDGSRDGVLVESVEGKGADDKELLDKVAALEERIATLEKEREELLATVAVVEKTAAAQQSSRLTHRGPMTRGRMFKATFHNLEGEERKVYVYVGLNDYGDVVEVFVTDEQGDEENRAYASATAKLASMALKYGIPVEEVEEALRGLKGASIAYESYGTFNSVPDMIAKLINYMRREEQQNRTDTVPLNAAGYTGLAKAKLVVANGTMNDAALLDTGMIDQPQVSIPGARKCPQCKQRTLVEAGGCPACQNCGYAKCS